MANRREFFKSLSKPLVQNREDKPLPIRPPYGKSESLFQNGCPTCESKACVTSCDEQIIFIDEGGTPTLNFTQSGCTFCEECAKVCGEGVLSLENRDTAESLNAQFQISLERCVAHHGVICSSCREPCIDEAILFNGMFNPVIDETKCTACGFCIARCPTQAIEFKVREIVA